MPQKFSWNLIDTLGQPIVGVLPTLKIREISSGMSFDWSDRQFKASGWTTLTSPMVEVGQQYPGLYEKSIDFGLLSGEYQIFGEYDVYSTTDQFNLDSGVITGDVSLSEIKSVIQEELLSFQGGLTSQQAMMLLEMYDLLGLDPTKPLVVTKISRQAGTINQAISSNANSTVVTRV